MNKAGIFSWLAKNRKKMAVIGGVLGAVLLLAGGLLLSGKKHDDVAVTAEHVAEPQSIYLVLAAETAGGDAVPGSGRTESFALHPTPAEVMEQARTLAAANLAVAEDKYAGHLVLWPCYFFKISETKGGSSRVLLDGAEDGFGATLITWLDPDRYPQLKELPRGAKLWLAGEISGVDARGTGTIDFRTDLAIFQEEMPESAPPPPPPEPMAPVAEKKAAAGGH